MPGDDVHPASGDGARRAGAGATKTLSGARRPRRGSRRSRPASPSGSTEPVVVGRARQAAGRPDELAARDGRDLVRRSAPRPGSASRPLSIGSRSGSEAGRALGGRRADRRRAVVASVERERAGRRPRQRTEVGGAAERLAEVAGERADVRPGRSR